MENSNEFWANVSMVAVSPVAIAAGFARGAYDASTDNGAFSRRARRSWRLPRETVLVVGSPGAGLLTLAW